MTDPTGGLPDPAHPSLTALAERDEGLLNTAQSAALDAHVASCARCADALAAVRGVGRRLATVPTPRMPAGVAARLDAVLAGEVGRREHRRTRTPVSGDRAGSASGPVAWTRPTLGRFGEDLPRRSLKRGLVPALAAAMTAAVVGFGAYVVSASAGLNEPPVVAAVSSASLAAQAGALERNRDLDPHRFSRAWQCARQATSGRIVALANSTLDGAPVLLVFTRSGATTLVTVVRGCETGRPSAGQSAPVSRR
jgi:hypothetical protein